VSVAPRGARMFLADILIQLISDGGVTTIRVADAIKTLR
jgi:hypothetical protein